MLHLPSKTIHQWLLDEIVNKRWILPDGGELKPKDPIIRPSCFKIVKLIGYSINQSQPADFTFKRTFIGKAILKEHLGNHSLWKLHVDSHSNIMLDDFISYAWE